MDERFYSLEEAAALMQTSEEMVRLWVSKQLIGTFHPQAGWRISAAEVNAVLVARRERAGDGAASPI
ncbi:MAG TPA: hypothetical protein VGE07_24640 [Herpetosiphonaceae bacterium]